MAETSAPARGIVNFNQESECIGTIAGSKLTLELANAVMEDRRIINEIDEISGGLSERDAI